MDQLAERDAIRNGNDVWTFDSKTNTATHANLPAGQATPLATPKAPTLTPDELAQRFLAAADSSTSVTLGTPTAVAGHSAYTLVLTPKQSGTLVASVQIAVESQSGMPLAVDVFAKGQAAPAFHAAFTQLELKAPDAGVFAFSPPAGATVKEQSAEAPPRTAPTPGTAPTPAAPSAPGKSPAPGRSPAPGKAPTPPVSGKGWDAVIAIPAAKVPAGFLDTPLVKQLAVPVAGGRLLSSSLVNILITDDGRVLAGAVPAAALLAAAAK
jgi:hypothetical protein